jgi:hypothetical protein
MLEPESTTSIAVGFPVGLRPLLAIVIVLAIAHMVLRARVRRAARRSRRTAQRRSEPTPMKEGLPTTPVEALEALRGRAEQDAQRS